jgi:BON domain
MNRIRICVFLLLAISVMLTFSAAQQPTQDSQQASQNSPPSPAPPQGTGSQPAQPQPQSMDDLNSRIQRSVEDILSGDPQLSSADVNVNVDDHAITLTGTVGSYSQHQRVLALMAQYSRYREIVDKLQTK